MNRALASIVLSCAALLAGCEVDLPQATEITHMRVLGARFEVVGDEERTTPKPGETLRVSMPVVFPTNTETTEDVETLLIGCTGPDRYTGGLPICQEFIDAAMAGGSLTGALPMVDLLDCDRIERLPDFLKNPEPEGSLPGALSIRCVSGDPVAEVQIPEAFTAENFLFLGVVCERGRARISANDPLLFGCDDSDGGEVLRFNGNAPVQYEDEQENDNPSLAPDLEPFLIEREGRTWEPFVPQAEDDMPPDEGCATYTRPSGDVDPKNDPQFHSVVSGAHRIVLKYRADARERFDGEPEPLQFTVYTTLGEMERRFTLFASDDEGEDGVLESELDWDPPRPSEVSRAGQLVRFFITLRDQRGGFALTERILCLR